MLYFLDNSCKVRRYNLVSKEPLSFERTLKETELPHTQINEAQKANKVFILRHNMIILVFIEDVRS
jgi:hypothetical protein